MVFKLELVKRNLFVFFYDQQKTFPFEKVYSRLRQPWSGKIMIQLNNFVLHSSQSHQCFLRCALLLINWVLYVRREADGSVWHPPWRTRRLEPIKVATHTHTHTHTHTDRHTRSLKLLLAQQISPMGVWIEI